MYLFFNSQVSLLWSHILLSHLGTKLQKGTSVWGMGTKVRAGSRFVGSGCFISTCLKFTCLGFNCLEFSCHSPSCRRSSCHRFSCGTTRPGLGFTRRARTLVWDFPCETYVIILKKSKVRLPKQFNSKVNSQQIRQVQHHQYLWSQLFRLHEDWETELHSWSIK